MISRLTGTIIETTEKYVVLDVHGVGYKLYCTEGTISQISGNRDETSLYTHLAVREDALDLYGFSSNEELGFFELLITVSGVGPKSALGILSVATTDSLKKAIGTGDTSYLTKVSGIGRKTAEKVVLELRDKLRASVDMKETPGALRAESDVVEALKSLGYSQSEARDALKEVPPEVSGTNARIKEALKILGQK